MESFDRQLNLKVTTKFDGSGIATATAALKRQIDTLNNTATNTATGGSSGGGRGQQQSTSNTRTMSDAVKSLNDELVKTKSHYLQLATGTGKVSDMLSKMVAQTKTQEILDRENLRLKRAIYAQIQAIARAEVALNAAKAKGDKEEVNQAKAALALERERLRVRRSFAGAYGKQGAANVASQPPPQSTWGRIGNAWNTATSGVMDRFTAIRQSVVRGSMMLAGAFYVLRTSMQLASQVITPFINVFKQFINHVITFTTDLISKAGEIENLSMRAAGLYKGDTEGVTQWAIEHAVGKPFNLEDIMSALVKGKAYGLDKSKQGKEMFFNSIIPAAEDLAAAFNASLDDAVQAIAQGLTGNMRRLQVTFGTNAATVAQYGGVLNATGLGISSDPRYREQNLRAILKSIEDRFGGTTNAMANTMKGLSEDMLDMWVGVAMEFKSSGFYQYFKDLMLQVRTTFIEFSRGKYAGILQDWVKRFSEGLLGLQPLVDRIMPYLPYYIDAIVTGMQNFGKAFREASTSGLIDKIASSFKGFIDFMFNTGTKVITSFYTNITTWTATLLDLADSAVKILPLAAEGMARLISILAGSVGVLLQKFSGTRTEGDALINASNEIWDFANLLSEKMPDISKSVSEGIQEMKKSLTGQGFAPDGSLPMSARQTATTSVPQTAVSPEELGMTEGEGSSAGIYGDGGGSGKGGGGYNSPAAFAKAYLEGEMEKMDAKYGALYEEATDPTFNIETAKKRYQDMLSYEINMKQELLRLENAIALAQRENNTEKADALAAEKDMLESQMDLASKGKDAMKKQIDVAEELANAQKKMSDGQKKLAELASEFLKPMGVFGMKMMRKTPASRGGTGGSSVGGVVSAGMQATYEDYMASQAVASAPVEDYTYAYGGDSVSAGAGVATSTPALATATGGQSLVAGGVPSTGGIPTSGDAAAVATGAPPATGGGGSPELNPANPAAKLNPEIWGWLEKILGVLGVIFHKQIIGFLQSVYKGVSWAIKFCRAVKADWPQIVGWLKNAWPKVVQFARNAGPAIQRVVANIGSKLGVVWELLVSESGAASLSATGELGIAVGGGAALGVGVDYAFNIGGTRDWINQEAKNRTLYGGVGNPVTPEDLQKYRNDITGATPPNASAPVTTASSATGGEGLQVSTQRDSAGNVWVMVANVGNMYNGTIAEFS